MSRRRSRSPAPAHTERVPSALRATSSMVPAGWTWRSRDAGARPEVDGLDAVGGEARQPVAGRPGPVEGAAEPGDDRRRGRPARWARAARRTRPRPRAARARRGARRRRPAWPRPPRPRWPGRAPSPRRRRSRWPRPRPTGRTPPTRRSPTARKLTTATRRSRRTPLVVVVLLAKRTSAWLTSSTMTTHPSARLAAKARSTTSWGERQVARQGTSDVSSGAVAGDRAHRDDSARALRHVDAAGTGAEGQPWLTGATWPGWPLPQLKAPPST